MKSNSIWIIFLIILSHLTIWSQVGTIKESGPGISERLAYDISITQDPKLGYVPRGRLVFAAQQRKNNGKKLQKVDLLSQALVSVTWTERGPNSDVVGPSNGNTRPGNGITSGRVRAIWVDLADATHKKVWVGGIDGGLWVTNDITVTTPIWTPINDFFGNMAIGSICQDPTNHNIMYFGTGEKAINADGVRGAGIWQSSDNGLNWNVMPNTSNYWNVSKLLCDSNGNLYVGCNSTSNNAGLVRYTKSTGTWTNITPNGLTGRIPDIELSSTGRLHVACGYYNTSASSAGYRFSDNPASVTSTTWSAPNTSYSPTNINVDLASNGNTLYALPSNASYEVSTIYKSIDGGLNWAATGTTPAFTSGQGWYCMAVAVDPNNANNVLVGSLDCYRSTNGGSTWSKVSNWVGTTGQYVHADQQAMVWLNNNNIIVASDGGIHLSPNGGTNFADKNTGLRIKQFYSVALHPTSTNYMLAGAQDNGTHQLNSAGLGSSVEVTGGDGAFVHIDQDQPQYQWGAYVYNQYRRSTNSGGAWSSINFSSSAGRFINPTDYDDVANIMYMSGAVNTYYRWSNPQTGSTASAITFTGLNGGNISAIKVSPYSANTVFMGGNLRNTNTKPVLFKVTNAHATPTYTSIRDSNSMTGNTNISCIELGTNENNIIFVMSNYGIDNVYVTTNGGASWSVIDGNLPDMPVRWAMFYPGDNTKAILGTETGVWSTDLINGASTVWNADPGFPNVRVDMFQYRASDGLLAVATHGRGIFTTTLPSAPSCGTVAGLTSSSITNTSATVSWSALSGALNYDVDYKANSSGVWINAATGTTALSVNLAGLTSGVLYDWRVRANCASLSGNFAQAQFTTTIPTCGPVIGLTSSAITTSSATISWSALSGALNYDVDYKANSSATWVNVATGTTSLSANLTGLAASTLYDWRVRANCSTLTGAYAQAQFTTSSLVCTSAYDNSTNNNRSGAAVIPFATNINGLINTGSDIDYYRFTISTTGTFTATLTNLPANYNLNIYRNNTLVASSSNTGTTNESITYNATITGTYYIRVAPVNTSTFNATLCYTARVTLGTATSALLAQNGPVNGSVQAILEGFDVTVVPNPATNFITIQPMGLKTEAKMVIRDITGKTILTGSITGNHQVDVSNFPSGIYQLSVTEGDRNAKLKFVKQ